VDRQIQPTELAQRLGISSATLAKLNAKKTPNEYVAMAVIERVCLYFKCPISDVIEIIVDENVSGGDKK
jgi:DNA-binding Xre family transcriptional regulator